MYKLIKDKGYSQNVILENTDTNVTYHLGMANIQMIGIIDHNLKDADLTVKDIWNITITKEQTNELIKTILFNGKITKTKKTKNTQKQTTTQIDMLDVLLGRVNITDIKG